jgi:hypothetical protein
MKPSVLKRSIVPRLQIAGVVIFMAICIAMLFVHAPAGPAPAMDAKARCEAKGDWWDDLDRVCAVPTPLTTITGHAAKTP